MNLKNTTTFLAGLVLLSAAGAQAAKKPAKGAAETPAAAAQSALDDFEAADWITANHEAATLNVGQAPGMEGQSLWLSFDMKEPGQWVAISKAFPIGSFRGKSLEFWIKGKGAPNTLEIKVVDEDGSNYGVKREGLANKAEWTRVTINEADLAYWWGGDNALGSVKEVHFAVGAAEAGAGDVQLDSLRLIASRSAQLPKGGVISDGETTAGWEPAQADGAKVTLTAEPGPTGKALSVSYQIPADQWVAVRRTLNAEIPGAAVFVFQIKGAGEPNNLEFKIVDRDDSVFGKTFEGLAGNGAWEEVRVPLADLAYLWGGDNRLDATLVRYIDIAISGPGGKGKVMLDDLKVVQ